MRAGCGWLAWRAMVRHPRHPWSKPSANLVGFRRQPRWKRRIEARSHGVKPVKFRRPAQTWGQAWHQTRPFILAIFLACAIALHQMAGFYEPPGWLLRERETVAGAFTRCRRFDSGANCVIDGDTFRLGERRIRVVGIDTAEMNARCPAEAREAEASAEALLAWLGRGPFELTSRLDEPTDRYGRELGIVSRAGESGRREHLAEWMREEGGARWYSGGWRGAWC